MLESTPDVYWVLSDVSDKNAGYRLRIYPICQKLIALGVNLQILSEQELAQQITKIAKNATTVISSKPGNTRFYLCLKYLKQNNIRVVIDLFDNYFSWSPLIHHYGVYWNWLRILNLASDIIVSTSFLKNSLEHLTNTKIRLISDPLPGILDKDLVADNQAWAKWQNPSRIELLWFGISSNPYYSVGLDDLLSWVNVVEAITKQLNHKFDLSLTICTKPVADIEVVLHAFNRYGINTRFVEWSEDVCDSLLEASHIVLIPTKLNGFSLSKTHNRCSDALARRCLVLTSPNSPYYQYGSAVLYSVNQLCHLLLTLEQSTIKNLINSSLQRINDLVDFDCLVTQFGLEITQNITPPSVPVCSSAHTRPVLIACRTNIDAIKFSRTIDYFVASFEGSGLKANFDIYLQSFDLESQTIKLVFSDKAYDYFTSSIIGNIDLEWSGNKSNLVFITDFWRFAFDITSLSCVITMPNSANCLQELSTIARMTCFHSNHLDLWISMHVEILCKILKLLNVTEIDIAGDSHHGWQPYVNICAPELAQSKRVLTELWRTYLGHEIDLGRPMIQDGSL